MPTTDQNGLSKPVSSVAGQELSISSLPAWVTLSTSPLMPPTRCRPMRVSGSRAATMTKNCSTSLS